VVGLIATVLKFGNRTQIGAVCLAGDRWAADLVDRMTELSGRHLQALWKLRVNHVEAPALTWWPATGEARLGDLLRDPDDREERLHVVVLMILRDDECLLTPDDDVVLASGDELLLAGLRVQGDGRPVRDVRTGHDRHD
jgi:hypothetical protein